MVAERRYKSFTEVQKNYSAQAKTQAAVIRFAFKSHGYDVIKKGKSGNDRKTSPPVAKKRTNTMKTHSQGIAFHWKITACIPTKHDI